MLQFRLFGIPFQIHWWFWLVCALLGGAAGARTAYDFYLVALWAAVVFVSITIHELGHAFAARGFRQQVMIRLHGLGGTTWMRGKTLSRWQNILVIAAGPAAGFLFYAAVRIIAEFYTPPSDLGRHVIANLLFLNLVWTLFNLLPVMPMDGGQILRDVLGPRHIRAARMIGGVVGIVLAALAARYQWFIAAILLAFMAFQNFKGDRSVEGGVERTN